MKLKTSRKTDRLPHCTAPVVYMEVYGSNRVIYRVTAGSIIQNGISKPFYGVMLEDLRSGECQSIADFSPDLEQTIRFANALIQRELKPSGLYDAAFGYLSRQVLSSSRIFLR